MRRRLLNLLTALSLLLCVSVVGLWVRSYWYADALQCAHGRFDARLDSGSGVCLVRWTTGWPGVAYAPTVSTRPVSGHGPGRWDHYRRSKSVLWVFETYPGGFGYGTVQSPRGPYVGETVCRWRAAAVPHWAVMVLSALLPCLWAVGAVRRHYRRLHCLCSQCGYDLRATPERCPECGMMAPARPAR